jgi:hypothetical protein
MPLNVAVLNLELLRMRLRKLDCGDDEKIEAYTRAIEVELRRLGRVFDAFFLLSTPPKNEGAPTLVDAAPIFVETAAEAGFTLSIGEAVFIAAHGARIRQAAKLFFEGTSKFLDASGRNAVAASEGDTFHVSVTGRPVVEDSETSKLFKLYYTDSDGNPDLSMAVARLIAETYGGELNAVEERDKVMIRLSFPTGAQ